TFQTGHPGVTTMWLGALGMGLDRARALDGAHLDLLSAQEAQDFVAARRALALAASVLLALLALLVARVFGASVAVVAGLLLALDPWLVAHNRVLHLDGLLALLVGIALLACLVRWQRGGGRWFVMLGGAAAGLAVLTKSSTLAILPPALLLMAGL